MRSDKSDTSLCRSNAFKAGTCPNAAPGANCIGSSKRRRQRKIWTEHEASKVVSSRAFAYFMVRHTALAGARGARFRTRRMQETANARSCTGAWAATGEPGASPQAGIPPEGSDMLGELSAGEDTESCAEADGEQRRLMGSGIHTNPGGKGLELVPCASDAGWCLGCTGGTCCGIGGRTPVCDIGLYVNRAVYPAR